MFFAEKLLKQVGLCEIRELHCPRRAAANSSGPAAHLRRWPKLTGAPPTTKWRRCRALLPDSHYPQYNDFIASHSITYSW